MPSSQFLMGRPMLATWGYWLGLPLRWAYQAIHNGHGIIRVLDITKFRPLPAGLVPLSHPWVTGLNPTTGQPIWHENVIYRTSPTPDRAYAADEVILNATGKFLAARVRQSAVVPELPVGPKRRMPHGINYIHGVSHYNSGILIFNDFAECYRHITDPRFQRELYRFVKAENREVLFLFREREYEPMAYAELSCCMRTVFPWFCNPNGPKDTILWGNKAPFPAANLITGRWVHDVYALKSPGGTERVIRPAIVPRHYFIHGSFGTGRDRPTWPERMLARLTHRRVQARGAKGGMFFVDRRKVYADQIAKQESRGSATSKHESEDALLDAHARPIIDLPLNWLSAKLVKWGLGANAITVFGFLLGILGCAAIAFEQFPLALGLILANRIADGLDGAVARRVGATHLGGFLDIVLDTIFYSSVPLAFGIARPEFALPAAFLIYSFVGTGGSFLAYAVIAAQRKMTTEARGKKSFFYAAGLMEGTETIIAFVLMCVMPERFAIIAWCFGGLCAVTTLFRIVAGVRAFREPQAETST